jgi:hypothetical protein
MKIHRIIPVVILLAGLSTLFACLKAGETQTTTASVPLDNAESASVKLRLAAGEMKLLGGAIDALMTGFFSFNRKRWEPVVDHRRIGKQVRLTVEQRRSMIISLGRNRNLWDLQFTNRIPLELEISAGAGRAEIDMKGLQVKRLTMHMGAGEIELDLSGERSLSLEGSLNGGVGSAVIYLPTQVGVRLRIDGGLGSVDARGLVKNGNIYTNEAYGKTAATIDLRVHAGIGSIELRQR